MPGEIRARESREVFSNFLLERQQVTGLLKETTWANRTLPGWFSPVKWEPGPNGGHEIEHGPCLEEMIMQVNEQGHDWHLCYGVDWDEEFMLKFAQMIRYGSDGKNPYDHYVENPKYPPLNPNLRIYVEHANELPWAVYPYWIWDNLRESEGKSSRLEDRKLRRQRRGGQLSGDVPLSCAADEADERFL